MPLASSDIMYLLSGGSSNTDPAKSLGGDPSQTPISDMVDNLFAQVTKTEMAQGDTVYRCCYVYNGSALKMDNARCWLDQEANPISPLLLGVLVQNESQNVMIGGTVTGGTFTLTFTAGVGGILSSQTTDPIAWSMNPNVTAANIATALNALTFLAPDAVLVSGNIVNGIASFAVTFVNAQAARHQNLLEIDASGLTGMGVVATVNLFVTGSPLNASAVFIGNELVPPTGIVFGPTSAVFPIGLGTFQPADFFAIWLQRQVKAATVATSTDGGTFNLQGHVFG